MFDDLNPENELERTIKNSPVPNAPDSAPRMTRPEVPTWKNQKPANPPTPVYYPRANGYPTAPQPLSQESAARERMRRRRVTGRRSGGEWAWVIIASALLGVVITISVLMVVVVSAARDRQEVIPTSVADRSTLPTPVSVRTEGGELRTGQSVTLDDGSSIILEPWDGQSRFTLLAMGLDRRPGERGVSYRTDTMMLISIDPVTQTIGILSIPRDLYVDIPGFSQLQRINTAMVLGENTQPDTGAQLAMQTVQYNLGIRVHDYVLVDFDAVIQLVDAIGGIDVTIDYTISDNAYPDMNYGYDPFYLAAGSHHLVGYDALRFARTRHGDSDIDRAERQQMVLYAVRDRILSLDMLPQLIIQAPSLMSTWEDNIYTDMTVEQMIRLAWYVKEIPAENIRTGVIDYRYTSDYFTPRGEAVLIPNRGTMGNLMVEVFGTNYSQ
ncbi:MAG: LCP family protein [Chitinophagaceae bacterium]|nr:LCP family protein [Anaerolineae bacterium]